MKIVLYSYMIGMLIFGTINTLLLKLTDMTESEGQLFLHPFFQCAIIFLGQFLCLPCYFLLNFSPYNYQKLQDPSQPRKKIFQNLWEKKIFAIPAFLDLLASTLSYMGLIFTAPSIFQMMRGFLLVVIAIYSIIFLKRSLFRHQWLGVALTFTGISIVGLVSVIYDSPSASNPLLGVIMLILSLLFAGSLFIVEQKFLSQIQIHPIQVVGLQGAAGLGMYILILPVLNLISCNNSLFCNGGVVQNSVQALKQIFASTELSLFVLGTMISIALLSWTGVSTTQKASALARSTVDSTRTFLVWIISICLGLEEFLWAQAVGFFILILGTLIYNEILIIPFWGFKNSVVRNKRRRIRKRRSIHSNIYEI